MAPELLRACLTAGILAVYAYGAWRDLATGEIPDRCPVLLLAAGLLDAALAGQLSPDLRLAGLAVLSLPMLAMALAVRDSIGGGDIKLCGASGFLLGPQPLLMGAVLAFLAAGLYGLWLLASRRAGPGDNFPLGPFLGLGFAWALLWYGPAG